MYVYFLQKLSYSLSVSIQNLIIYKFTSLYHIFEELDLDLNFKISFEDNERSLKEKIKKRGIKEHRKVLLELKIFIIGKIV